MVGAEDFVMNTGGRYLVSEISGDHEIVNTPSDVLLTRLEAVRPPGILDLFGIQHTPRIHEAGPKPIGKLAALLIRETGIAAVRSRILQVNLLMRHIEVATNNDTLLLRQAADISAEIIIPTHPVIQTAQLLLGIRNIHADQIEVIHFQCNNPSLMVMLINPDTVSDRQRFQTGEHGRPGITLLVSVIPVGPVALELKIQLPLLHLGLLNAEEIRIQRLENILKTFAYTGPQAIDIPRYKLHRTTIL